MDGHIHDHITQLPTAANHLKKLSVSTREMLKDEENFDIEYSEEEEEEENDDDEDEEDDGNLNFEESLSKKKRSNLDGGFGRKGPPGGGGGTVAPLGCQVEGCKADLRDLKTYYKRHKVCTVHAKVPVVLIAGLRQRFCQQCSRFHELSEFDEAKRSCRRRLAGHNERRRKSSHEHRGETSSRRRLNPFINEDFYINAGGRTQTANSRIPSHRNLDIH